MASVKTNELTNKGHTLIFVTNLPFPWPPQSPYLLHRGQYDKLHVQMTALDDGRLHVVIIPSTRSFLSQPIDINSDAPRTVTFGIQHSESDLSVYANGQRLLPDAQGVAKAVLTEMPHVVRESSLNDPRANVACQQWVQNRKAKFSHAPRLRANRHPKTIEEQAIDLRVSVLRLRHLAEHVSSGNKFLLGTLAGEMRASIYWFEGTDAQPEKLNNPLLLRMANLAGLPLPVYHVPKNGPEPPALATADMHYDKSGAPRIVRLYATDEVRDLQESLVATVLRLGPSQDRRIKARDLIKELAVTMGAAHYDEDASDFLEVLHKMETAQGDYVSIFMCQTAAVLASLSEWVLSELKTRNIIG